VTTYRLVIRREADSELTEAAQWYEEHRRGLGGEFLDEYAELTAKLRRILTCMPPFRERLAAPSFIGFPIASFTRSTIKKS
jgi:hypothetical protein